MNEFIIKSENLNYKMENHNMKLPDKVFTFKSLHGASVSENQRQTYLKLANDLNYCSMRGTLKCTFEDEKYFQTLRIS